MASVALADRYGQFLCLHEESGLLEFSDPGLSALVSVHALVFARMFVHGGVVVHARDHLKSVPLSDLEVVRVVGRGDLDRAGPLFGIGIFVRDDRDLSSHHRQDDRLSDEVLISFVIRMHRDRDISEHGLRP